MKHEQFPGAVPRCDTIHALACKINSLQDEVTAVLGEGFALLAIEQAFGSPSKALELRKETDTDPELTAFLGTLGLCSFNDEPHSQVPSRQKCIETYDELQRRITWYEDTISLHTVQHKLGECASVEAEPWKLEKPGKWRKPGRIHLVDPRMFGYSVPKPRTP